MIAGKALPASPAAPPGEAEYGDGGGDRERRGAILTPPSLGGGGGACAQNVRRLSLAVILGE